MWELILIGIAVLGGLALVFATSIYDLKVMKNQFEAYKNRVRYIEKQLSNIDMAAADANNLRENVYQNGERMNELDRRMNRFERGRRQKIDTLEGEIWARGEGDRLKNSQESTAAK